MQSNLESAPEKRCEAGRAGGMEGKRWQLECGVNQINRLQCPTGGWQEVLVRRQIRSRVWSAGFEHDLLLYFVARTGWLVY
jgi:hypothetical protein